MPILLFVNVPPLPATPAIPISTSTVPVCSGVVVTWIPFARLPVKVEVVMSAVIFAVPCALISKPLLPGETLELSRMVVPVIVNCESVPLMLAILKLFSYPSSIMQFVMFAVPVKPFVPPGFSAPK